MGIKKRVLFLVGYALGHVARGLVVARALRSQGISVHFLGSDRQGFLERLLAPQFTVHDLKELPAPEGQAQLRETLLYWRDRLKPSCVIYDLGAMRLALVPPLDIPEVYLTNSFLTLGERPTAQDERFEVRREQLNRLRASFDLPPLTSARDLYERDLVLLADPPALVGSHGPLPPNYRIAGPCIWEPNQPMPAELEGLEDILYVSMGSTGRRRVAPQLLRDLAAQTGCRHIVEANAIASSNSATRLSFDLLPGSQVLSRARFALTQGGTGSVYQAFQNGVPTGCWPTKPTHAVFGQVLRDAGLTVLFEQESWKSQLEELEERLPGIERRTQAIARSWRSEHGGPLAAKHISRLL